MPSIVNNIEQWEFGWLDFDFLKIEAGSEVSAWKLSHLSDFLSKIKISLLLQNRNHIYKYIWVQFQLL